MKKTRFTEEQGRVIEVLSRLVSVHGSPRHLRSDNGPEFVSRAVLRWLLHANIDTAHIHPGKPWQNGSNESFNGRYAKHWKRKKLCYARRSMAAALSHTSDWSLCRSQ